MYTKMWTVTGYSPAMHLPGAFENEIFYLQISTLLYRRRTRLHIKDKGKMEKQIGQSEVSAFALLSPFGLLVGHSQT